MIKKDNGAYCVYDADGKTEKGTYKTQKEANEREAELSNFKKKNKRGK